MSSLVFVGELNPYGADPFFALYHLPRNASGNRLREILGLTDVEYYKLAKVNLCTGRWSMPAARRAAAELLIKYSVIVCLGGKVRLAFNAPPPFCSEAGRFVKLISLPHPSGMNRMWDEPGARERARALLAEDLAAALVAADTGSTT